MNYKAFSILSVGLTVGIIAFIFSVKKTSVSKTLQTAPCDKPLTYQFGSIDPRFNMSKKELSNIMQKVEKLWATAMNKELLTYHRNGRVTINLVYSEHQQKTNNAKQFYHRIQIKKEQRDLREQQYQRLAEKYRDQRKILEQEHSKYEKLIENYNTFISGWDKKGGIPKNRKRQIKMMERAIKNQKEQLNRQRRVEASRRKQVNEKADRLNALVMQENNLVNSYNNKYGKSKKFNQGKYTRVDGNENINIYQFANAAELKTVLAHETGHAMGLQHIKNPVSIMFWMMGKQDIFDLKLSEEDIATIKDRCSQ